jgi:hypothetical protein
MTSNTVSEPGEPAFRKRGNADPFIDLTPSTGYGAKKTVGHLSVQSRI